MSASDAFTRASPTWLNAQRLGARSGNPLQVMPPRRRPLAPARMILEAIALTAFLALFVFGMACGFAATRGG